MGGLVLVIAIVLAVVYWRRCRTRKMNPSGRNDGYLQTLNGDEDETNIDDDVKHLPGGTGDTPYAVSLADDSTVSTFVNRDSTGNAPYSRSIPNDNNSDNNSGNGGYLIAVDVDSDPVGKEGSSEKTSNQNLGSSYYLNEEQGEVEPGDHSSIRHEVQKTPTELATEGNQNTTPSVIPPQDYYLNQDQEETNDDAAFGEYMMTNSASGGVPDNLTTGSRTTMFPRPLEIKSEEEASLRDPQVKKQPVSAKYSITDA